MHKTSLFNHFVALGLLLGGLGLLLTLFPSTATAQADGNIWNPPINISNSEGFKSAEPFLLADPAGGAHLFWAERTTGDPGNINSPADTIMYANWDGNMWSEPVDIFISPPGGLPGIQFPQAILDDQGTIHLIWIDQPNWPNYTLFYSSARADEAGSALTWQPPVPLAEDLTGTNFSVAIAFEAPQTLHILYARVRQGFSPPEQRATSYIRSIDGGLTWSAPVDLYTIPELENGASNTRLLVEPPGRVYATWSEWDSTGNGQRIFFNRSLDSGQTWEQSVVLAERTGIEYERDWANMALLGSQQIVVAWEGGFRAYRNLMYSFDGGETWSEPVDTFPGLIGENGFAEFARDGAGNLHLFVAQRIREGNPEGLVGDLGIWHSVWEGGTIWQRPTMAGGAHPMVNPKVVIVGGNQVVAAWYSQLVQEIMVMTGELVGVPAIPPQPWPTVTPQPEIEASPTPTRTPESTPLATAIPDFSEGFPTSATARFQPATPILFGILPVLIGLAILIFFRQFRRHTR